MPLLTFLLEAHERVRAKDAKWNVPHSVHLNVRNATTISAVLLEACEARGRERQNTTAKVTASLAGRLQLYRQEMTEREKQNTTAKGRLV